MARTSKFPDIEEGTEQELNALARGHSIEKRASLRSRIVLDWMEGFTFKESVARNGVSEMTGVSQSRVSDILREKELRRWI